MWRSKGCDRPAENRTGKRERKEAQWKESFAPVHIQKQELRTWVMWWEQMGTEMCVCEFSPIGRGDGMSHWGLPSCKPGVGEELRNATLYENQLSFGWIFSLPFVLIWREVMLLANPWPGLEGRGGQEFCLPPCWVISPQDNCLVSATQDVVLGISLRPRAVSATAQLHAIVSQPPQALSPRPPPPALCSQAIWDLLLCTWLSVFLSGLPEESGSKGCLNPSVPPTENAFFVYLFT